MMISTLLAFCFFAEGDYRVSAKTVLEPIVQRAAAAPFEGYIREAPRRAGDLVHVNDQGQLMVSHTNLSGLLLDALHQLDEKVRRLEGDIEPIVIEGSVQDPSRWLELPESTLNEQEPRG